MGNYHTSSLFHNNETSNNIDIVQSIDLIDNGQPDNILYSFDGTILKSPYTHLSNTKVLLLFCENDLIIRTPSQDIVIIYQCIIKWYRKPNIWGFLTKESSIVKKGTYCIQVNNPEEICNIIKNITAGLVEYYKNI